MNSIFLWANKYLRMFLKTLRLLVNNKRANEAISCVSLRKLIYWSIKETFFLGRTQQQLESLFSWRCEHFTLKFVPFMNNTSFFMSYSKINLFDVPFAWRTQPPQIESVYVNADAEQRQKSHVLKANYHQRQIHFCRCVPFWSALEPNPFSLFPFSA